MFEYEVEDRLIINDLKIIIKGKELGFRDFFYFCRLFYFLYFVLWLFFIFGSVVCLFEVFLVVLNRFYILFFLILLIISFS